MNLEKNLYDKMDSLFKIATCSDANILITGETGTGKSFLAKKIHENSSRSNCPFISINLATLHEGVLESELFGHEKGAFTGADQKRLGRLEAAQNGTVFLDEIGDLSARLQARLLDFLQSKQIVSVGGNKEISLNVRIIAATHNDLEKSVNEGRFREDLFHRLRVIEITMKPLREREEEFGEIVHECLRKISQKSNRSILKLTSGVAEWLESYDWPGNIRELENVLEYSVLSASNNEISLENLPPWLFKKKRSSTYIEMIKQPFYGSIEVPLFKEYNDTLKWVEKEYLTRAFEKNRGKLNRTAEQIGINKTTLGRRLKEFGII